MKKILIIRHSDSEKNHSNGLIENKNLKLSIEGLNKILNYCNNKIFKNYDLIVTSSYNRTIETGTFIAKANNIKLIVDDNIGERIVGDNWKNEYWEKQLLNRDFKCINGESSNDCSKRFMKSINYLFSNGCSNFIMVSHGAIIKFLLMHLGLILESCDDESKSVIFKFKDKTIINNKIDNLDGFLLYFSDNNELINVEYIPYKY